MIIRSDDFIYFLPHPALRGLISNYTITFPCTGLMSDQYAVMPHGSATLVFTCDEHSVSGNLFGPITKPAYVGQSINSFSMIFIVEFHPAGYYAFSEIPQKELTDLVFSFEEINSPLNGLITWHLETADSIESFIVEIDKLFFAYLKMEAYSQEFYTANQLIIHRIMSIRCIKVFSVIPNMT